MAVLVGQGLKQTPLSQYILEVMKSNSVIPPLLLLSVSVEIDHASERYS